jgi:hypothetical protein
MAKLQSKAKEGVAATDLKAKIAIEEEEVKRLREIEAEIAACVIKSPRSGLAVYHVPEAARFGSDSPVVAQGEPVREGQKLLRVCNLERFAVTARIHEAQIARVRVGQRVTVRVDAFPKQPLAGRVKAIAPVAVQQDWLSADVKVYPVVVELTDQLPGLRPGMSAEVRIEVERLAKALRVPVESIVRSGREAFCYVKVGNALQERKVTTGARNDFSVEIKAGLKEGEQVLRSPRAVASSPAKAGAHAPRPVPAQVLVRSVRPLPGPATGRSRLEAFGLTYKDLARIRTVPDATAVVPVRRFPAEVHRLARRAPGLVIGTVPGHRELAGIQLAAGRFLEEEGPQMNNVAVLGADVAERLFPEEDAVGKVVRCGGSGYVVVGVLREQEQPVSGLAADEVNRGVYLPLQTCRARFGEVVRVRRAGSVRLEAVPLTEVLVAVPAPEQLPFVVESISALLEDAHPRKDWEVLAAPINR